VKNILCIFGFVILSLILQTTLIPSLLNSTGEFIHWKLLMYQSINIIFLILLYICFSRSFFSALFWFCVLILLQNSFDVPWKGSLALSYFFLVVIIYLLETMYAFQYSFTTMMIILFFILLQNIFHLMMGGVSMGFEQPFQGEIGRLLLVSIMNVLVAPFVFYCLYLIDRNTIFHFDKSKSFFGRRVGL
jgi:hypothetical protein